MMHLVELANGETGRVAVVADPYLRCLEGVESVYALAQVAFRSGAPLSDCTRPLLTGEELRNVIRRDRSAKDELVRLRAMA